MSQICSHCKTPMPLMSHLTFCPFCRTSFPLSEGAKNDFADEKEKLLYFAERGDADATYRLSRILRENDGENADFWLHIAAEIGNADAAFEYAPYDSEDELYFLTKAALMGHRDAAEKAADRILNGDCGNPAIAKGLLSLAGIKPLSKPGKYLKLLRVSALSPTLPDRDSGMVQHLLGLAALKKGYVFLALYFLDGAYSAGIPEAALAIGKMYEKGNGVIADSKIASIFYRLSAEDGVPDGAYALGNLLLSGDEGTQNAGKALQLFAYAAEKGHDGAATRAFSLLYYGIGGEKDVKRAIAYLKSATEKGYEPALRLREKVASDAAILFDEGCAAYRTGNMKDAVDLFTEAADRDHGNALLYLGHCFREAKGTLRNYKAAMAMYEKALQSGVKTAGYCIGKMYAENKGANFDANKATEYCMMSEMPEADALITELKNRKDKKTARRAYSLSTVLLHRGDISEALHVCAVAAKNGNREATVMIGYFYEYGIGIPKDLTAAAHFYRSSSLTLSKIERLKKGFCCCVTRIKKQIL